jgi:hypothetical protein
MTARTLEYNPPPPVPLSPELLTDVAGRRADNVSWVIVGATLKFDCDALRAAAEADPRFAPALDRARAELTWQAEAAALRRLNRLLDSEDEGVAARAAEAVVKAAAERRRNDTRLAVEKMRAETALAKVAAKRAEADADADPYASLAPEVRKGLESEWKDTLDAWNPLTLRPRVYLWGGQGPVGRGAEPDENDPRVRIVRDDARGVNDPLFWVVPDDKADALLAREPSLR